MFFWLIKEKSLCLSQVSVLFLARWPCLAWKCLVRGLYAEGNSPFTLGPWLLFEDKLVYFGLWQEYIFSFTHVENSVMYLVIHRGSAARRFLLAGISSPLPWSLKGQPCKQETRRESPLQRVPQPHSKGGGKEESAMIGGVGSMGSN